MTEQNQQPHAESAAEAAQVFEAAEAAPTYEDLQAKVAELEGMLKDEQLRSLANEQNLRRRHQEEIQATHKFASPLSRGSLPTVRAERPRLRRPTIPS